MGLKESSQRHTSNPGEAKRADNVLDVLLATTRFMAKHWTTA